MPRSMRLSFSRWVWLTAREQRGEKLPTRDRIALQRRLGAESTPESQQPRQGLSSAVEGR